MDRQHTPETIRSALSYIPPDCDHESWVRMAMATKSALGDAGFDIWDEWSQGAAAKYDARTAATTWKHIDANGKVTAGTLFHEAGLHGFNIKNAGAPRIMTQAEIVERDRLSAASTAKEAKNAEEAQRKAAQLWREALLSALDNPYLKRKGVASVNGLREIRDHHARQILGYTPRQGDEELAGALLVVPIKRDGELVSVELIDGEGRKHCIFGSKVSGAYWAAPGLPTPSDFVEPRLCIGEGVATMLSIREATDLLVVAARYAGNLEQVALGMKALYPKAHIVIAGDRGNGQAQAEAAARNPKVGGFLALPVFAEGAPDGAKDFNDLHRARGVDAVRACIEAARASDAPPTTVRTTEVSAPQPLSLNRTGVVLEAKTGTVTAWPEPFPLLAEAQSKNYPLDALPGAIGEAVREVVGFVQCPGALAACSALSAVSLVIQGLVNVRRAEGLSGPTSLYLLAIAESGERKTTCDGHFLNAIRAWEAEQADVMAPEIAKHCAKLKAWEARCDGIVASIKERSRKDQPSEAEARELEEMETDKPVAPKVPRVVFGDTTPEALAWNLASGWPSAGVLSSEAGIVFGGHGMKADSAMRNLALLNVLWDGGSQRVDRRQSGSFIVRGARLTMGLAAQPETVRAFLEATKGLARGSGFAARFLIAWPESTQGARPFREPPDKWPHLSRFHQRAAELLAYPLALSGAGELTPAVLDFTPEAKAHWIAFHDEVEAELRAGGDMETARDVASKAADNAARLAALFHVFEQGPAGMVGADHLRAGARIAAWHLYEARRFLGTLALPRAAINARKLEAWLLKRCNADGAESVSTREVRQFGPATLRVGTALQDAIAELAEAGRATLVKEGKQVRIHLNPAVLRGDGDAP